LVALAVHRFRQESFETFLTSGLKASAASGNGGAQDDVNEDPTAAQSDMAKFESELKENRAELSRLNSRLEYRRQYMVAREAQLRMTEQSLKDERQSLKDERQSRAALEIEMSNCLALLREERNLRIECERAKWRLQATPNSLSRLLRWLRRWTGYAAEKFRALILHSLRFARIFSQRSN
jgi:septal ring factor EnvC (AmiA/AmiB activator)